MKAYVRFPVAAFFLAFVLSMSVSESAVIEFDFSKKAREARDEEPRLTLPKDFDITKSWELRLEFYTESFDLGWHQLVCWGDKYVETNPMYIRLDANKIEAAIWDGKSTTIKKELRKTYLKRWVPVRFCYDSEQMKLGLFLDGKLVRIEQCKIPECKKAMPIVLGAPCGSESQNFYGKLRRVSLFNYGKKTASELPNSPGRRKAFSQGLDLLKENFRWKYISTNRKDWGFKRNGLWSSTKESMIFRGNPAGDYFRISRSDLEFGENFILDCRIKVENCAAFIRPGSVYIQIDAGDQWRQVTMIVWRNKARLLIDGKDMGKKGSPERDWFEIGVTNPIINEEWYAEFKGLRYAKLSDLKAKALIGRIKEGDPAVQSKEKPIKEGSQIRFRRDSYVVVNSIHYRGFYKVLADDNIAEIKKYIRKGFVIEIERGTSAIALAASGSAFGVRIIDGEHKGKQGWVPKGDVEAIE